MRNSSTGSKRELQALYAEGALQIEELRLDHPASAASMNASGRLAFAPELAVDLRSTWSGLQWPLRDQPQAEQRIGPARAARHARRLRALARRRPRCRRRAGPRASGRHRQLGGVRSRPDRDRRAATERRRSRRRRWRPQVGAAIELAGRLRDRAIELSAQGEYSTETLRLETLSLRAGATRIDASGTAGQEVALQWRIDSPDLGDLWPSFSGRLSANGKLERSAAAAADHRRRARRSSGAHGLGGRRARIDGGHRRRGASDVAARSFAALPPKCRATRYGSSS